LVGDGAWLTVGEVAALLELGEETVRQYMAAGRLDEPTKTWRTLGGHRRIHKDSAERLRRELRGE
jgi:excisionase family DNA binding protein